jgi:hypothetical protein
MTLKFEAVEPWRRGDNCIEFALWDIVKINPIQIHTATSWVSVGMMLEVEAVEGKQWSLDVEVTMEVKRWGKRWSLGVEMTMEVEALEGKRWSYGIG